MVKRLYAVAILFACSSNLSAGVISYSAYNGDANGLIRFESIGQEWLNLDQTNGLSYNEAEQTFSTDGFRVATLEDMHLMLTDLEIAPMGECEYLIVQSLCRNGQLAMTSQLEHTFDYTAQDNPDELYAMWNIGSHGRTDVDWSTSAVTFRAVGIEEYDGNIYTGVINMSVWLSDKDSQSAGIVSTFMVRDSNTVPEPKMFTLMGAGLLGLGLARRRRKDQA